MSVAEDMGITEQPVVDCAVIGAGPSGLMAAMYLRRFHRPIVLLDADESRARWIPKSHNCPGFPGGVSGDELLATLREQAKDYGVAVTRANAIGLSKEGASFRIDDDSERRYFARSVILATGVVDILPDVAWTKEAIATGSMRLCAICDGYEASDTRLAVFGPAADALKHALFLRTYSQSVVLAPSDAASFDERDLQSAIGVGIELLQGPCALEYDGARCSVADSRGQAHCFDTVYPVLGSRSRSDLALAIGAKADDNGELIVDKDQMTSVEGLYAIGDVVSALNQISVGTGHAAIAATAAHNFLKLNPR